LKIMWLNLRINMQHRFKKMTSTGLDQQKIRTWADES